MMLLQLALCMLSALLAAADNTATSLGWNTRHGSRAAHRQHTHTKLHPSICRDPTDCTAELQAALDAGGTITLTCTQDQPSWVTRPLNVTRNNTWLGLGAGCELLAKRGEFKGEFDALLTRHHTHHEWAFADRPTTNARIEGLNRRVIEGAAAALLQAKPMRPIVFGSTQRATGPKRWL